MIRLQGLTLSRGGTALLDRADASIGPGERIALVGQNGTGKTTLLAALAGELPPDGGEIVQPWRDVSRLEQGLPHSPLPAWRFIVAGDARLSAARLALGTAERDGDGMALAYRAGVPLKDMEFVQYHPTGLPNTGTLLTEA